MNKFVVVSFSLNAGVVVYGPFATREEGYKFATEQFNGWGNTHSWSVEQVFAPDEDED